jgi:excisionase family DNA binding protein
MSNHDDDRAAEGVRPGDFLTIEETARLFRLEPGALKGLQQREGLPAYRVGSRLLFNRHELGLWLAARRIEKPTQ